MKTLTSDNLCLLTSPDILAPQLSSTLPTFYQKLPIVLLPSNLWPIIEGMAGKLSNFLPKIMAKSLEDMA